MFRSPFAFPRRKAVDAVPSVSAAFLCFPISVDPRTRWNRDDRSGAFRPDGAKRRSSRFQRNPGDEPGSMDPQHDPSVFGQIRRKVSFGDLLFVACLDSKSVVRTIRPKPCGQRVQSSMYPCLEIIGKRFMRKTISPTCLILSLLAGQDAVSGDWRQIVDPSRYGRYNAVAHTPIGWIAVGTESLIRLSVDGREWSSPTGRILIPCTLR